MRICLQPDMKHGALALVVSLSLLLCAFSLKAEDTADPLQEALEKGVAELQWTYISPLVQASSLEVLEWKALMSEGRYQIEKNPFDKFDLILQLERLINKRCLGRLPFDLSYLPSGQNKECSELVEKLLELDPDNAPALCVRDGVEAASCRDSYLRSIIWTLAELATAKKEEGWRDFNRKLSDESAELRKTLPTNLQSLAATARYEYLKKPDLLSYLKLQQSYSKLLAHSCEALTQITVTRAEALGEKKGTPTPTPKGSSFYQNSNLEPHQPRNGAEKDRDKSKSPMEKILETLKNPDTEEDNLLERLPPEASQIRARIISTDCSHQLDQLFKGDKNSPLLPCARDGLYSTFCFDALKRDRKVLEQFRSQAIKSSPSGKASGNSSAEAPVSPSSSGLAEF